jgi:hypothetical protein
LPRSSRPSRRASDALSSLGDLCEVDIFCGVFTEEDAQGGFVLDPELSRRLAELGLAVVVDVY